MVVINNLSSIVYLYVDGGKRGPWDLVWSWSHVLIMQ